MPKLLESSMKMTGGGNKKKGIPPTATNFYGLSLKNVRSKAGMTDNRLIKAGGDVTSNGNPLIDPLLHNVIIIPSGTGVGDESSAGLIISDPYGSGQLYARPYGKITANHGLLGPDSLAQPLPSPYQYGFVEIGKTAPHNIVTTPNPAIVSQDRWEKKTRYIKSVDITTFYDQGITTWDGLSILTIAFIAGNDSNGLDTPDAFAHNRYDDNQTGLLTDALKGDYRRPENLYVQFYDSDNNKVGNRVTLWRTKEEPSVAALADKANGIVDNVWGSIPLNKWVGNKFAVRNISRHEFGDISNARFFLIRQEYATSYNDNYSVKHISVQMQPSM